MAAQARKDPAPSFTLKLLSGKDFDCSELERKLAVVNLSLHIDRSAGRTLLPWKKCIVSSRTKMFSCPVFSPKTGRLRFRSSFKPTGLAFLSVSTTEERSLTLTIYRDAVHGFGFQRWLSHRTKRWTSKREGIAEKDRETSAVVQRTECQCCLLYTSPSPRDS